MPLRRLPPPAAAAATAAAAYSCREAFLARQDVCAGWRLGVIALCWCLRLLCMPEGARLALWELGVVACCLLPPALSAVLGRQACAK